MTRPELDGVHANVDDHWHPDADCAQCDRCDHWRCDHTDDSSGECDRMGCDCDRFRTFDDRCEYCDGRGGHLAPSNADPERWDECPYCGGTGDQRATP